ncbi:Hypothetical protein A7982_10069 [Minicystis rosea]|nr:Hypothetical protein A7982_10069 [Minicystis rosea]
MNGTEWVTRYRDTAEADRADLLKNGLAADPQMIDALLAWAADAEGVESGDFWLFSDLADQVRDRHVKARLQIAEAELRWLSGDSQQNVLSAAIGAIGFDADLPRAYEITYELLINTSDLVWEDAFERLSAPKDAIALLRHLIERGDAKAEGAPWVLSLAPKEGAQLSEVDTLVAAGRRAEAIAARRGATGEDFATARRALFATNER